MGEGTIEGFGATFFSGSRLEFRAPPDHFDEFTAAEAEVDLRVVFENGRVVGVGVFESFVYITLKDSGTYTCGLMSIGNQVDASVAYVVDLLRRDHPQFRIPSSLRGDDSGEPLIPLEPLQQMLWQSPHNRHELGIEQRVLVPKLSRLEEDVGPKLQSN
jgi:hypothetical protein